MLASPFGTAAAAVTASEEEDPSYFSKHADWPSLHYELAGWRGPGIAHACISDE
jgi:hypothetical protein